MTIPATLARFAKRIATQVRGDRPPSLTDELIEYIDRHPRYVNHSLEGLRSALEDDGEKAESMIAAYMMLLSIQLESLRFRIDVEDAEAREVVDDFQRHLASLARSGELSGTELMLVTSALHEAKIPPSADLLEVSKDLLENSDPIIEPGADIQSILADLADQFDNDVFAIQQSLEEYFHAMPPGLRAEIVKVMADSPSDVIRDAGALCILDADPQVRRDTALALFGSPHAITPATLRRLIAIRAWWPDSDRHLIDQAVRAAREKGVDCASWEPGGAVDIRASVIDGSGAQGFLIVTPAGRRQRISSVLTRHGTGIFDAWSGEPETRKRISATLAMAEEESQVLPVSRAYLDREICRHLYCAVRSGALPPVGLIQVAETVGASEWRPRQLEYEEVLDQLCAELPEELDAPAQIENIIDASDLWGTVDSIADSWFEDGQEVRDRVTEWGDADADDDDAMLRHVLDDIIEPRKAKWIERLVWTASLLREAEEDLFLPWREFTVLARALADGRPVSDVPLMENIAYTTMVAHGP